VPAAEALIRLASGDRTVPVLVGSAALHHGDGVVTGAIAALQDITLLKELDRAREEFLGAAAHDLKTPLTSVQGLAQLARRRLTRLALPQTQPVMQQLEGIEAASRRMVTLINDLIDVTRLQMGALLTLDRRPTDLVALARAVIGRQHDLDHRLMLETELENLVVTVDPDRIERVLDVLTEQRPAGEDVVVNRRIGSSAGASASGLAAAVSATPPAASPLICFGRQEFIQ